jgi:hypothetical protein
MQKQADQQHYHKRKEIKGKEPSLSEVNSWNWSGDMGKTEAKAVYELAASCGRSQSRPAYRAARLGKAGAKLFTQASFDKFSGYGHGGWSIDIVTAEWTPHGGSWQTNDVLGISLGACWGYFLRTLHHSGTKGTCSSHPISREP